MQDNYNKAYNLIRRAEGGLANLKHDTGGKTNHGVTQATYNAYRKRLGQAPQDVEKIEENEVKAIYRNEYAQPVRFDDLPLGLDYMAFDFAIHSGVKNAAKALQRLLDTPVDGIMGVHTLDAIQDFIQQHGAEALLNAYHQQRQGFIRALKNYKHFKKGWERRLSLVREHAFLMHKQTISDGFPELQARSGKAEGSESLSGSIRHSRRSQAAIAGGVGLIMSAVPEALQLAQPAKEAFAVGQYAALIGSALTAAALFYIVWIRSRERA